MKKNQVLILMISLFFVTIPAFSQKYAYVNSQRILSEYEESVQVQNKIEELRAKYDGEYQQHVQEYNQLIQSIESQSLLLSPEKKDAKLKEAQNKAMTIEQYKMDKFGPEGELYRKNLEFSKPIIDKINNLIAKIGEDEGYDFIFDAASGVMVFAKPKYDITEQILDQLNKGAVSGKK